MASELPIRCACGNLRGMIHDVAAKYKNHVVCYCDDCQLFAHSLGCANTVLDPHGGTDILQMSPAALRIDYGADKIACLRLRPGGLFRWYAGCCNTPIGNTLSGCKVPYLGLVCSGMLRFMDANDLLHIVGPVHLRVNARFAKGDMSGMHYYDRIPPMQLFPMAIKLMRWRMQGGLKPSALFNVHGHPVVEPRVLSDTELNAAIKQRQNWLQDSVSAR